MLKYVLNSVIYLSLAVWIGSLIYFQIGVVPILSDPSLGIGEATAGGLIGALVERLADIELAAAVLLLGGTLYSTYRYGHALNWGVVVLSVGMLAGTAYKSTVLAPEMIVIRREIGNVDRVPAEKRERSMLLAERQSNHDLLVNGVLFAGVLVLFLHTVALVRYTEMHESRYRTLLGRWNLLSKESREPAADEPALDQPVAAQAASVESRGPKVVEPKQGPVVS